MVIWKAKGREGGIAPLWVTQYFTTKKHATDHTLHNKWRDIHITKIVIHSRNDLVLALNLALVSTADWKRHLQLEEVCS